MAANITDQDFIPQSLTGKMAFSLNQYGWDNMLKFIVVIKTPSFK